MKLIFCLIAVLLMVEGVMAGVIELKEKVEIDQHQILLKDLANFKGVDKALLERLKDLVIGSSPLPGKSRWIDLTYIQGRIATLGKEGRELMVFGPERIEVVRSFQRLEPTQVVEMAQNYILSKLKNKEGQFKLNVCLLPKELILPPGQLVLEVVESASSRLLGPVYIETRILIDGKEYNRIKTGFKIQRFQKVITAARTLNQHQVITREDVKEEVVETTGFVHQEPLVQIDSVIGKRTRRPIKEGTVFVPAMLETLPVVRQGSIVTIKGEIGNVRAMTLGKALQDAREGEKLMVRNLSSKKAIEAIAYSNNLVVVTETE